MKSATLAACALLVTHVSSGQQMEYSFHLNSGGSAFRGASAGLASDIHLPDTNIPTHTFNPYGKQLGFSYGLAGQAQRVTEKYILLGVQAGYEVLQSRIAITHVVSVGGRVQTTGHTTLTNQFVNIHPLFGHRFALKGIDLDLTAGPELGLLSRSHEEGKANTQGYTYTTDLDFTYPKLDVRARLNIVAYYKHIGLTLGYSRGLTNYYSDYVSSVSEVYSQVFRAGLAYRI